MPDMEMIESRLVFFETSKAPIAAVQESIVMGKDFGFVFDIDGVILRGDTPIPGAAEAVKKVQDLGVPYVFMTNNGMESEAQRADRLAGSLGLDISKDNMILCHSALKEEAPAFGNGLVLVTGHTKVDIKELMKDLGFKNPRTIAEYGACHPGLVPNKTDPVPEDRKWADEPVKAVILLETPVDWQQDLQVICDILRSNGNVNQIADDGIQHVKFIACNFDFTFVNHHPLPRFGPGAFIDLLGLLFSKSTGGRSLEIIKHGKPHRPTYNSALRKLLSQQTSENQGRTKEGGAGRVYALGDNPKSDVRGANMMGKGWVSVLVRTGCFQGEGNDPDDPADYVVEDVSAAVNKVLEMEGVQV
ncbi:hypothetical protein BSKO_07592 [Bryopsis sp. KO-2023]|nr:hypothetical protein BSKO_07592 [Bryopsis sp. KO-2023]